MSKDNYSDDGYLAAQMKAVSRTFAVVVAGLDQPLKNQLSTAYLLCRVLDNIEDCTLSNEFKKKRFEEFCKLMNDPTKSEDVLEIWNQEKWSGLTADEEKIMGFEGRDLWRIFSQTPAKEQEIIKRWVMAMLNGMRKADEVGEAPEFTTYKKVNILAKKDDYNEYCYIVAGVVGHLATELVNSHYEIDDTDSAKLIDYSEACGRLLQKTNILKDFNDDLKRDVCYLPDSWLKKADYLPLSLSGASKSWQEMVMMDILDDLKQATEYILMLPERAVKYRQSSLLCLLPALETNLLASKIQEQLFTKDHDYKISRVTLGKCMVNSRRKAGDNDQIQEYVEKLHQQILNSYI